MKAPATKLAFTRQPSAGSAALSSFARQPMVTVQNTFGGTVTTDSSLVQLSITPPGGGAAIRCSANGMHAVHGVATFAGCDIDQTGTYTLTATDGALAHAVSTRVTITPAAAGLVVTTDAGDATGGLPFATQPVVHIVDAFGHVVTTDTSLVLLSIGNGAGVSAAGPDPMLTCDQNPVRAGSRCRDFSGCSIDQSGSYTLTATDGTLAPDTTDTTVTVGPPAQVGFTTEPSGGTSLAPFGTQPSVAVQDAGGNTVVGDTSGVTLALTTANGGTLACAPDNGPQNAIAGVADFGGCNIDKAGSYTLTATDGTLDSRDQRGLDHHGRCGHQARIHPPAQHARVGRNRLRGSAHRHRAGRFREHGPDRHHRREPHTHDAEWRALGVHTGQRTARGRCRSLNLRGV